VAGIHPEEPFDVQPYARRTAFAFLHKELTDNLPRKFKIAFSRAAPRIASRPRSTTSDCAP
jgi:sulfite reductase beta subunit-like hemoprotein